MDDIPYLYSLENTWKTNYPLNQIKILLIRADYIGDVLLTTHTLKAIRKDFRHPIFHFWFHQNPVKYWREIRI